MTASEITRHSEGSIDFQAEHPGAILEIVRENELPPNILRRGAAFRFLRYIDEHARFTDDDENRWLFPHAQEEPVIENLAQELSIPMSTLQKRMRTSQVEYGYLVVRKGKFGGAPIVNLGITPLGTADLARYVAAKETPPLEAEGGNTMLEVEYMTMTCIDLARELGKYSIVKNLRAAREEKAVLDMGKEELEAEFERITWTLESLRKAYVKRVQAQRQFD